ncbi:hypothetical protein [Arsenophonus endosymbiont of Lipoptena cervi]|uniref:hypothetical protein n=1 Tax=Arsenophonus endosymbiont of Lipoptena cervi TaxID=363258 RepID=UPI00376EB897
MNGYSKDFFSKINKKIKIKILLGDISSRGGIEKVSISLANVLSNNYDITIISLYKSHPEIYFKLSKNVNIYILHDGYEESMYNRKKNLFKE